MTLKLKEQLCGQADLYRLLDEMVAKIAAEPLNLDKLVFIGILKGGAKVAERLAQGLSERKGIPFPTAFLDIRLYRDDVIDTENDPFSRTTEIPFAVKGKEIILVDDVLFTGRTVRAALSSIVALGRPQLVRLAVVVDRGFRELPIHADYVGRTVKATRSHGVRVRMEKGLESEPGIYIYEKN